MHVGPTVMFIIILLLYRIQMCRNARMVAGSRLANAVNPYRKFLDLLTII